MRETKTIKRMYSQSKIIVVLLFVGLVAMGVLSSCDKTKKFDGTVWKGNYDVHDTYTIEEYEITIFFIGSEVEIKTKVKGIEERLNIHYFEYSTVKGRYAYNKKKMTIYIDDGDYYYSDGENTLTFNVPIPDSFFFYSGVWTGTVAEKTMEMKIAEETITFEKQ
jgi:hypothetical protein